MPKKKEKRCELDQGVPYITRCMKCELDQGHPTSHNYSDLYRPFRLMDWWI